MPDPRSSEAAGKRPLRQGLFGGGPLMSNLRRRRRTCSTVADINTLVLVEGDSDAGAVCALADLFGCDLDRHHVRIYSAGGVTNFSQSFSELARTHPNARVCGLYDLDEERHVRRALANAAIPIAAHESLESFGFFACVADLEDELIRALGAEAVQSVLEAQGELASFRRFQTMPHHRLTPVDQQLRRFLGTRATRKIRSTRCLVECLDVSHLPRPLMQLAATLFDLRSTTPNTSIEATSRSALSAASHGKRSAA